VHLGAWPQVRAEDGGWGRGGVSGSAFLIRTDDHCKMRGRLLTVDLSSGDRKEPRVLWRPERAPCQDSRANGVRVHVGLRGQAAEGHGSELGTRS
jgi:hypothetical protein